MPLVQRFTLFNRILHVVVILSFMGLVITGMPLKYSDAPWARWIVILFGDYQSAHHAHRVFAVITFGYFFAHLCSLARSLGIKSRFHFPLFGPESMAPRKKDFVDLARNIRWFVGKGPAPAFDRWTYWEKFDYWAVVWGVGIIGTSGLLLWFPEFFGRFLPGWIFNIAALIHSDEALLAAGFIFAIHFFNTHLRPGKFPMDTVIFTGRLSLEELKEERPVEYERLVRGGQIKEYEASPAPSWVLPVSTIFGYIAISLGLFLLVLIIIGQFFY